MPNTIRPGIIVRDYYGYEETIYPTGDEWLLAFAIKGCQWAIDAINSRELGIETQWLEAMQDQGGD